MEKEGAPKSQDDRTHHSEHKNSIHLNTCILTKILKLSQPYSQANYSSYQFPGWTRWSNTLPKLTQLRLNVGLSSNTIDISFRQLRRRTRKAPIRLDPNYTSLHWLYGEYIIITPVQAGLYSQPWGERVVSKGIQKKIATLEGSLSAIDECLTLK